RVEDVVLGDHPVDNAIKDRQDAIKAEIDKNGFFSRRTLFLIGAIILSMWALGSLIILFSSFSEGVGSVVASLMRLIIFGGGDAFCIYKYRLMKNRKSKAEEEMKILNSDNTYLKQQIYDLIQNDSIPEEGKREIIENWIRENERNWQVADAAKTNSKW
ncbi:MAG: hypothetical protein IJM69_04130, partial [Firmicutes bacterium]|nr:hypothetical protein [Bacillota bacterium]